MSVSSPKLPSSTGPKSTMCEVQQWTTTTVIDAQAKRERFITLPSRTDDSEGGRCEVFRWIEASVGEVLKLKASDTGLKMRCVECKQPVRFNRAKSTVGSPSPYFEHYERNLTCSRSEG